MSFIKFAIVAENEVFHILSFDESNSIAEKWIAAFRSNVEIVNVNEYKKIRKGYLYNNGNFYGPEDTDFVNPISKEEADYEESIVFAGVIDNEVIGLMTFVNADMQEGYYELVRAGMFSNPTYHEVSDDVQEGWIFDGTNFSSPRR